jgi:hypothetical protein
MSWHEAYSRIKRDDTGYESLQYGTFVIEVTMLIEVAI